MKKNKIKTKLKKDDLVKVISGKYRNKQGKILNINRFDNLVLVEGINVVKKTIKKTQENPKGGITEKEAFIHLSKVMYLDNDSGKGVRLGCQIGKGKKERFMRNKSKKVV